MTKLIELITSGGEPLTQTLPLTSEAGEPMPVILLRATAAALLANDDKAFSLRYTDSDGDEVTIAHDADVKELADYMADEQLERVTVLVASQQPAVGSALQTQLRGLVTAMSKLTTAKPKQPTPANAMNLLVASLQTMDVVEDSEELAAIKKELLAVLEDEEFKKAVEELSASEEFKELADIMVTAIYKEDAQAIEEVATARFDELLVFAQRLVARCPTLKPAMINVAKNCISGLLRLNDEELADDGSDSSSSSSDRVVEVPVHLGVICDGCKKAPLVGVRYKSLETPDFDLCEDCEASGKWVNHEPFIKITNPSHAPNTHARRNWWCTRLCSPAVVEESMATMASSAATTASLVITDTITTAMANSVAITGHKESRCPGFRGHGRPGRFSGDEEQQESGRRRHGRGRWGRDASDLEARFLEDVTIEDGTVVEAGKPLRKMWKLVNDGERSWPDGCYMITQPGNPMFPDGRNSSRIDLPALAPGEEFIAGVDLVAPTEPGRYTSFWRVCDPADVSFGHRFWIDVVVAGGATPEPTPSEAPTADSAEDEMKESAEGNPSTDAPSDDDIEIIEAAEAQEAEGEDDAAETVEEGEATDKNKMVFEESLKLLEAMGFADSDKTLRALELQTGMLVALSTYCCRTFTLSSIEDEECN
ncbi:Next to BRCA1, central domain [Phytophthora cactorum]|nr:Next to BRCA1, central domain [Phytophthora cactorum]